MQLVLSALLGAAIGWLLALATEVVGRLAAVEIGIGIAGAVPAAWFLAPLGGHSNLWPNLPEAAGAIFGASFLLALFILVRGKK